MFHDKLRKLRKNKKMSQDDMALLLGMTRQGYAKYENNQAEPSLENLKIIADHFDISIDELLERDERQHQSADDEDFEAWLNDPRVAKMYSEFKESSEERREALLAAWEYLKSLDKK